MSDPITQSYLLSDAIGRAIFIGLWFLSIVSWTIIVYRGLYFYRSWKADENFLRIFETNKHRALSLAQDELPTGPMMVIYQQMRSYTLGILAKNRQFGAVDSRTQAAYLSMDDIQMVAECGHATIQNQLHKLESNVHHLSTIVTLSPFLGLLGTVWGILCSFTSMHSEGMTNDAILVGLSMALATTVVGLVVAIPALLGYNAFRIALKRFENSLGSFSSNVLNVIELQYRKVDKPL